MKTIWKFPLKYADEQTLEIPQGARILCVQLQWDEPFLWALVNPQATKKPRRVRIYGTGHELPDYPGEYIGTFQVGTEDRRLVYHVFEV